MAQNRFTVAVGIRGKEEENEQYGEDKNHSRRSPTQYE